MVTREMAIFQTILCVITQSLPDDRRDPAACHMGDVVNYDLIKVARTKPSGTDWAFDFMSDVRDMQRAVIDGSETHVRNAMLKDGSTAQVAATALRNSFEESRAKMLTRQDLLFANSTIGALLKEHEPC